MDKESYVTFYDDLNNLLETIKTNYLDVDLKFLDGITNAISYKELSEEELKSKKDELIKNINNKDEKKVEIIVDDLINSIKTKIKDLKESCFNIKNRITYEYNANKVECKKTYDKVNGCVKDKDGFIKMLINTCYNQYINKKDIYDKMGKFVKSKRRKIKWQYVMRIFWNLLVFLVSAVVQVALFPMIGTRGICMGFHVDCWGRYIILATIIIILVCQVMLIRRVFLLFKKKDISIQYMDVLLNKVDMATIPIDDVDRELERVLQIMKE